MSEFCVGQRWISNSDANLGLGIVTQVAAKRVTISFPAAGEERIYSMANAPLSRITYKIGDTVKDMDERSLRILNVQNINHLCFYEVQDEAGQISVLAELDLDCSVQFNAPQERLLSGQVDPLKFFELRQDAAFYQQQYKSSPAVGLLGPRVQLLKHQLYIAHQVGSRIHPRVLLADEVGLGKTIEAGLIIHRQLCTGLAERILIVVPDSLLHQWLVEMLRRFNLSFSLLDQDKAKAYDEQGENPFESQQLILCTLSFIVNDPLRQQQASACHWDILLVDEAHHLHWSENEVSLEYLAIESLANAAKGVLLLTATPEQLGLASHFARLRLLDPKRYFSLAQFSQEQQHYQTVNQLVLAILANDNHAIAQLSDYISPREHKEICALIEQGEQSSAQQQAINALLDRHGTGRIFMRNTRAAINDFPKRRLQATALKPQWQTQGTRLSQQLYCEQLWSDEQWLKEDLRVSYVVDLLSRHSAEKFLLICAHAQTAMALEEFLSQRGIAACAFHEHLSLLQRDKAAAYFADSENAAQILVCSEIGSEGRNFQFAHHIILFDLPLNPDLLEQRIGRLDRIGQTQDIMIHLPYYQETAQEVLMQWYHFGLNAFEQSQAIGQAVFAEFETALLDCLENVDPVKQHQLIEKTAEFAQQLRQKLQAGRDQLLEMNSCRPAQAQAIIEHIKDAENRLLLEDFVEHFSDQIGIKLESHSKDCIILYPSSQMQTGSLPGLPDDGLTATYSRDIALSRDDLAYLSWENPIIQSALSHILDSTHGNSSIATLKLKALKPGTLLLESFFKLNCVAPKNLQLDRFLPEQRIRILLSLDGKDLSAAISHKKLSLLLEKVNKVTAHALIQRAQSDIEHLIKLSQDKAQLQLPDIIDEAMQSMMEIQKTEIYRLKALAEKNPAVRADELEYWLQCTEEMQFCLSQTQVQTDALRLIISV